MIAVPVSTTQRSYEVVIGSDILGEAGRLVTTLCPGGRAVIVSDENVAPHYLRVVRDAVAAGGSDVTEVVLPSGEAQKVLSRAEEIYGVLYERHITRGDVVVALGGGVIGDLAGFAAATYLRGLRLVQVPTTLLAQVDAAVGGKVGVDFRAGKNHVGTFYQPHAVLADVATLATLPAREWRGGAMEVIKYGLLAGGDTLVRMRESLQASQPGDPRGLGSEAIVADCVRYKSRITGLDEREETGERHLLNLGHTIGHALEAAGAFSRYSHGEAVGLGLRAALWLSQRLVGLPAAQAASAEWLLDQAGAPRRAEGIDPALVERLVARDKKAKGGDVPFVLLAALGVPVRGVLVPAPLLKEVVEWLKG